MEEKIFYVYGHYRADTGEIFYIGKGTGRRAWIFSKRNAYWKNIANKHGVEVKILYDNLTEQDAFSTENRLITEIGLDNLSNLAEGGKGLTSDAVKRFIHDPIVRQKHLVSMRTPEMREQLSQNALKNWQNPAYRKKRTDISRALAQDPEWKQKAADGYIKRSQNMEWKARCKDAAQRKAQDPEWKRKNAEANRNKAHDPEIRKKWKETFAQTAADPAYRKKMSDLKDHQKKEFTLISPIGEIVHVRGLAAFAKEHGLSKSSLGDVVNGRKHHHSCKGWKLYNPDNINETAE